MNDLLPCKNNRLIIPNTSTFYLDKNKDQFWSDYACRSVQSSSIDALFPEAIEANTTRMKDIMKRVDQVRGMTAGNGQNMTGQTGRCWEGVSFRYVEECSGVAARADGAEEGSGEAHHDSEGYSRD